MISEINSTRSRQSCNLRIPELSRDNGKLTAGRDFVEYSKEGDADNSKLFQNIWCGKGIERVSIGGKFG